jgi:hypothetical protein
MHSLKFAQTRFLAVISFVWLAFFILTRSLLLSTHLNEAQLGLGSSLAIWFFCYMPWRPWGFTCCCALNAFGKAAGINDCCRWC